MADKMNDVQKTLSTLLKEITDVCCKNNIAYSLYGATGAGAVVTNEINRPSATIMINVDDFEKLIEAVNENLPENRAFDYMGNCKNFKSFSAYYSDPTTTCISLNQNRDFYASGLYVEIVILRKKINSSVKRAGLNILEHGWEGSFKHIGMFTSVIYFLACVLIKFRKAIFGKSNTAKWIFKKLLDGYTGPNARGGYYVKRFNSPIIDFSTNPLKKLKPVEIYNNIYFIKSGYNGFLARTYSQNWYKAAGIQSINKTGNIISTSIPYTEMMKELSKSDNKLKKFLKSYNKKWIYHSRFIKLDKIKKNAWLTAKITGDRLELAEFYAPLMDYIRSLCESGDYFTLSKVMKKHRRVLVKHLNRGVGFAVNRELFEIQLDLFRLEGKYNIVQKLESITPEVYMNSIG